MGFRLPRDGHKGGAAVCSLLLDRASLAVSNNAQQATALHSQLPPASQKPDERQQKMNGFNAFHLLSGCLEATMDGLQGCMGYHWIQQSLLYPNIPNTPLHPIHSQPLESWILLLALCLDFCFLELTEFQIIHTKI